jgi:hypothetical protein
VIRKVALVRQSKQSNAKVKHFVGMPPELTQGQDDREKLPTARFLVLEERPEGFFLFRYAEDHSFAGDTWHMNFNDAIHQAEYEYGDQLSEWREVPPNIDDSVAFAFQQAL